MPSHTPITVVLAHFDDLFAGGLRKLIESDPSLLVVAADVQHRRIGVVLRAHRPDVVILDFGALVKLAEVRELSSSYPETRLLLLGHDPAPVECAQALAFGASACLGRDTQSRDVINAIHLASRGLQVIPQTAGSAASGLLAPSALLTRREVEVFPLLQRGDSNAQIALALGVGVETVRTHATSTASSGFAAVASSPRRLHMNLISSPAEMRAPPEPAPSRLIDALGADTEPDTPEQHLLVPTQPFVNASGLDRAQNRARHM